MVGDSEGVPLMLVDGLGVGWCTMMGEDGVLRAPIVRVFNDDECLDLVVDRELLLGFVRKLEEVLCTGPALEAGNG